MEPFSTHESTNEKIGNCLRWRKSFLFHSKNPFIKREARHIFFENKTEFPFHPHMITRDFMRMHTPVTGNHLPGEIEKEGDITSSPKNCLICPKHYEINFLHEQKKNYVSHNMHTWVMLAGLQVYKYSETSCIGHLWIRDASFNGNILSSSMSHPFKSHVIAPS